jgi:hypothetical protein
MSHPHQHSNRPAPRAMGLKHGLKLFLLNAVLYGACAAFAGLMVGDYLVGKDQGRIIIGFMVGPLVLAVISTISHMKAHAWTSVDDMAERFVHPHQPTDRHHG